MSMRGAPIVCLLSEREADVQSLMIGNVAERGPGEGWGGGGAIEHGNCLILRRYFSFYRCRLRRLGRCRLRCCRLGRCRGRQSLTENSKPLARGIIDWPIRNEGNARGGKKRERERRGGGDKERKKERKIDRNKETQFCLMTVAVTHLFGWNIDVAAPITTGMIIHLTMRWCIRRATGTRKRFRSTGWNIR